MMFITLLPSQFQIKTTRLTMARNAMAFILLAALTVVDPLTVYDCGHRESTITVLDLHEPKACPDPDLDYFDPETRIVQIIQTEAEVPVLAYQCSATYSQQITRCGFNSITYGSVWAAWQQPVTFTPGECRKAVEQGLVTVNNRLIMSRSARGTHMPSSATAM